METNRTGQPILQTPIGQMILGAKADIPIGSRVTFEILAMPDKSGFPWLLTGTERSPLTLGLNREWQALDLAMTQLAQVAPESHQIILRAMPQPGSHLSAQLFAFLYALRSGDLTTWLGQAARQAIELVGGGEMVNRLADEFALMSRTAGESPSGEWRSYLIPIYHDDMLRQMRLYVRDQENHGRNGDDEESGTRFIVDVEFSRLGTLQLDGLYRGKTFNLIVRTPAALPDHWQQEIGGIFRNNISASGLAGEIAFQTNLAFRSDKGSDTIKDGLGLTI